MSHKLIRVSLLLLSIPFLVIGSESSKEEVPPKKPSSQKSNTPVKTSSSTQEYSKKYEFLIISGCRIIVERDPKTKFDHCSASHDRCDCP